MTTYHITGNYSGPENWLPIPDIDAKQKATQMKDCFLIKTNSVVKSLANVSIHVYRYPWTYTVSADVTGIINGKTWCMRAFWDIQQKKAVFAEHRGVEGVIDDEIQVMPVGETPAEWAEMFFQLFCKFLEYLRDSTKVQYETMCVVLENLR